MKKKIATGLTIIGLAMITTGSVSAANDMFTTNLGSANRGERVTELQNFLSEKGYLSASARGNFGSMTRSALMKFQKDNGIHATGFFGPLTREKARSLAGMTTPMAKKTS